MRQQFGQHEIPEKHLHQQRHVAEDLHVRRAQHVHQPGLRRAHHAQPSSQQQRKAPRRQRQRQRPAHADQDRFQEGMHAVRRHLQENAPTPVVIHACALDRRRPRRLAPKPPRDAPGVPRTTCLLVCLGVARIRRVGQRTLQGVAHRILQVDLLGRDRRIEVLVIDRGDFAGLDQVQHGVVHHLLEGGVVLGFHDAVGRHIQALLADHDRVRVLRRGHGAVGDAVIVGRTRGAARFHHQDGLGGILRGRHGDAQVALGVQAGNQAEGLAASLGRDGLAAERFQVVGIHAAVLARHQHHLSHEGRGRERHQLVAVQVIGGVAAFQVDGAVGQQRDTRGRGRRVVAHISTV
ncbi:hypothetical protein G6F68_010507 [Rhizopus microsporus]|nr:hypothetical protein G6F68_010507 [Rhizopus microsporus]